MYVRYIYYVLDRNPIIYLQEVSLGALIIESIPAKTFNLLSEHCSNLITCKVLLQGTKFKKKYQHCPGVVVDCNGWFQITNHGLSIYLWCK